MELDYKFQKRIKVMLGVTAQQYLHRISSVVDSLIWRRIPASEDRVGNTPRLLTISEDRLLNGGIAPFQEAKSSIRMPPSQVVTFPAS